VLRSEDDAFHDLCELAPTFLAIVVFVLLFRVIRLGRRDGRQSLLIWSIGRDGLRLPPFL